MNSLSLIRRLHEHRNWGNGQLLNAAAGLTAEKLRESYAIGQGSIWKSLVHMYAAEYVWLATLRGDEAPLTPGDVAGKLPGNQLGEEPIASVEELREKWQVLDERWNAYLAGLSENQLDDLVPKVSSQGMRHLTARGDILLHVCLHAHYTTAQVVNMLRQAGIANLPDAMLITMSRQQGSNGVATG